MFGAQGCADESSPGSLLLGVEGARFGSLVMIKYRPVGWRLSWQAIPAIQNQMKELGGLCCCLVLGSPWAPHITGIIIYVSNPRRNGRNGGRIAHLCSEDSQGF